MDARATLNGSQSSIGIVGMFVVSLLVAVILGVVVGYLLRGFAVSTSSSTPSTVTTAPVNQGGPDSDRTRVLPTAAPVVVEQAPYSSPTPSPAASPILVPKGFTVPI